MILKCLLLFLYTGLSQASDYPVYFYDPPGGFKFSYADRNLVYRIKREDSSAYTGSPCAVTTQNDVYPWWRVELPYETVVTQINISNPSVNGPPKNFEVRVGKEDIAQAPSKSKFTKNHLCAIRTNIAFSGSIIINCNQQVIGKYVSIQVVGPCTGNCKASRYYLPLCEVEVRGFQLTSVKTSLVVSTRNQNTQQSSVSFDGVASLAVDGDKNSVYATATQRNLCGHLYDNSRQSPPHILYELYLGSTHNVKEVTFPIIPSVLTAGPHTYTAEVFVQYYASNHSWQGEHRCGTINHFQTHNVINCIPPQMGKYVVLKLTQICRDRSYCQTHNLKSLIATCDIKVIGYEVKNLATGQVATQSTTAHNGNARLAIDGKSEPRFYAAGAQIDGDCSQTYHQQRDYPWWRLEFHREHLVDRLLIYNRADALHTRLHDYEIQVGNEDIRDEHKPFTQNAICKTASQNQFLEKGSNEVFCDHPLIGRYVTIQIINKCRSGACRTPDDQDILSLCEVEVYGFPLEYYDSLDANAGKQPRIQTELISQNRQTSLGRLVMTSANSVKDQSVALVSWWVVNFPEVYAVAKVEIFADFKRNNQPNRKYMMEVIIGFPRTASTYNNQSYNSNTTCFEPQEVDFTKTYQALKCKTKAVGKQVTIFSAVSCRNICNRRDTQLAIDSLEVQVFKIREAPMLNEATAVRRVLNWNNRNSLVSAERSDTVKKLIKTTHCTQTLWNDPYPIWYVDLKTRAIVSEVTIVNRNDGNFHQRLHDIEIRVGTTTPSGGHVFRDNLLCAERANQSLSKGTNKIMCTQPVVGRYVSIQIVRLCESSSCDLMLFNILTLCEVEIKAVVMKVDIHVPPTKVTTRTSRTAQSSTLDSLTSDKAVDGQPFTRNGKRQ